MDSKIASHIWKAESRNLKQRAQARDRSNSDTSLSMLGEVEALNQQDTDYPVNPNLEKMDLKIRERNRATPWPVPPRPYLMTALPEARNYGGTLWRRFPNGSLAEDTAISEVEQAVRKRNHGIVPLAERELLVIAAVFPEIKTPLPKHIVEIKARLAPKEKDMLRARSRIWPLELSRDK